MSITFITFFIHCCNCINISVISKANHLQLVQQPECSTRINSSSVHTYICVCFIRNAPTLELSILMHLIFNRYLFKKYFPLKSNAVYNSSVVTCLSTKVDFKDYKIQSYEVNSVDWSKSPGMLKFFGRYSSSKALSAFQAKV